MARLLLAARAGPGRASTFIHYDARGPPPLHEATLFAGDKLAMLLARAGDPDVRTTGGVTPLHVAVVLPAGRDTTHAVELLVAAGSDVDARLADPAALRAGLTAHTLLDVARELAKPAIAAFLERAGAGQAGHDEGPRLRAAPFDEMWSAQPAFCPCRPRPALLTLAGLGRRFDPCRPRPAF